MSDVVFVGSDEEARRVTRHGMIRSLFTYHQPNEETVPKYQAINEAVIALAIVIDETCPESPDRNVAMQMLQQVRMTANSSIANNGAFYR